MWGKYQLGMAEKKNNLKILKLFEEMNGTDWERNLILLCNILAHSTPWLMNCFHLLAI